MIELSAQIAQPQEPSRADSPLESLAGRGPGRTKDAKEKDKTENFASLVKNLLENVKNAAPGLAEGQIQPENTGEALKPGKNQGRKSATLTIIPQDKDGLALSKVKTGRSGIFRDETDGNERLFLSKLEETDRNTGLIGSIRHEQETQDLPFPVEEGDFPQNDGIHSLAGLMQRNDAGEAAGSGRDAALKDRNVLFAGLPGKTGRTEASGQDPRRGLADLNKAGKGDQEEVRDRRRERIARSPGAGNRFEIRDFRGDAEIKSPLGKSGDFGFSGPGEVPETELVVRLEGRSQPESRNSGESPLRETLSQELRGALGQDIVRHASMILKDGGEGLIRLSLKPESLGNVKIRLELSENKIAGRIIVENSDALRAFERELPVLEAAFRDSGFDGASLELAQDGARGEGGQRNREEARPFYSESLASSSYDALLEYRAENSGALIRGETRVNMLA